MDSNLPIGVYVVKAFHFTGGQMSSLSASGVLEHKYELNKWTHTKESLLVHGLGLFVFYSYQKLFEAYYGHSKSSLLRDSSVVICRCLGMDELPVPKAIISMHNHDIDQRSLEDVLSLLDQKMPSLLEEGSRFFKSICPVEILSR